MELQNSQLLFQKEELYKKCLLDLSPRYQAQKAAGKEHVRYLHSVYPDAKIVSHGELNATACPGANFPLAFMRNVTEEASEWAKEAVEKWKTLGVLLGDGNGNYGLQEPVTLERVITLVERRLSAN